MPKFKKPTGYTSPMLKKIKAAAKKKKSPKRNYKKGYYGA